MSAARRHRAVRLHDMCPVDPVIRTSAKSSLKVVMDWACSAPWRVALEPVEQIHLTLAARCERTPAAAVDGEVRTRRLIDPYAGIGVGQAL